MDTRLIFSIFPSKLHSTSPCPKNLRQLSILCSTVSPNPSNNSEGGSGGSSSSSNGRLKESNAPTNLNIRYRVRSRSQRAKQEKQKPEQEKEAKVSKKWEEMKLSEKALEVYLGEKGLLFWLNKLAYASIFAVIGGWILFRFVGPSLGLYQLDSPPLSPTSIFRDG